MKLFKIGVFLLAVAVLLTFPVSCNMDREVADTSLVNVFLNIPGEKALSVSDIKSGGNLRYFYTAVPQFSGYAEGVAQTPVQLAVSDGTACIGSFSQGSWIFTVFAVDSQDNVVLSGSTSAILKAGTDNVVSISLSVNNGNGEGCVSICFTGPYLGEGDYSLVFLYRKAGEEAFSKEQDIWEVDVEDPSVIYSGSLQLPSGTYEARFIYIKDGIQTGGETFVLNISDGFTSFVEGNAGEGLVVNNLVFVNENMVESGKYRLELNVESGSEVVLAWNCLNSVPISIEWDVGSVKSYGSTLFLAVEDQSPYLVSCSVLTQSGEETAEISIEVSSSEPEIIDLLFLRCPGLTAGTACVGYEDLGGNPVEFPYSFNGKVTADKNPSDYGLVPVIKDVTIKDNVKKLTFIEVRKEWERNKDWGDSFSIVASKISSVNSTLKYAVITCDPLPCAFSYCTVLDTMVFAYGVETVSSRCCQGDKNLKTVYLSKSVRKIESTAFQKCSAITCVYIEEGSKLTAASLPFDDGVSPTLVFNCKSDLFRRP